MQQYLLLYLTRPEANTDAAAVPKEAATADPRA